jgi:hypothetical protein
MGIVLFNVGIAVVQATGAYSLGIGVWDVMNLRTFGLIDTAFWAFVGAVAAASLWSLVKTNRGPEGAFYALFGAIFMTLWTKSSTVIESLYMQMTTGATVETIAFVKSFTILLNVVVLIFFIVALGQAIKGGWRGWI